MITWATAESLGRAYKAPKEFIETNGFTKALRYCNEDGIVEILKEGTFESYNYGKSKENVPYLDHAIIYKNTDTNACCLVYLPYEKVEDIRAEVAKWAESKGLKAEFYEHSWYNDKTCTVIISPHNVNIVC